MSGRHHRSRVLDKQWVTPRMVRLTLDCGADFVPTGTDSHVAVYFYPPEARVPAEFTAENLTDLHRFASPQVRRYTVRNVCNMTDTGTGAATIDLDVVVHEPAGLASGWARDAVVGDEVLWWGPTEAWHLPEQTRELVLVADETGLPAVAEILAVCPDEVRTHVLALVDDERDEPYLATTGQEQQAQLTWIHRGPAAGVVPMVLPRALYNLLAAVTANATGPVSLWAGGEFAEAGTLRRHFSDLERSHSHVTSYWIHGQAQDARPDARNRRRNLANRAAPPAAAAAPLPPPHPAK
ncbi:MAG: siderophore-interacting protein [Corynebacterium sp.]|nr:siderophore-interacting protein [Corynebacterium sp.]